MMTMSPTPMSSPSMCVEERGRQLARVRRLVIKIGSALLTADGRGLDRTAMAAWVRQMVSLRQQGIELILVSSGAVAEGVVRMGMTQRPQDMHALQACAAIGQMGLVQAYADHFLQHGVQTAQVLLTHDDLRQRQRYLNARQTLRTLASWGVVPVINENDTVATDEIRLGDNDTLAAWVAQLVDADLLVILTDQEGMFDRDPRQDAQAQLFAQVRALDESLLAMAGGGGRLGRGGMYTKVKAARLAAQSGASTLIASGRQPDILLRLLAGEVLGTLFVADQEPLVARKQWLAAHLQHAGRLVLDAGAVAALRERGGSLLAVGVRAVEGDFKAGEVVACLDQQGRRIAVGQCNYSAAEARQVMGLSSDRIAATLGYAAAGELIHRDNLFVEPGPG